MKTQHFQSHHKPLALALAGTAAALAAPGAHAVVISNSQAQAVTAGSILQDIGGMTGVALENSDLKFGPDSVFGLQFTQSPVVAGSAIGAGSTFAIRVLLAEDPLKSAVTPTGPGIYGVYFNNGQGTQYGWVDVDISTPGAYYVTVRGWGYETEVGANIAAGAVSPLPEPTTPALMALGLFGMGAMRRRARLAARAH
jgi:hypothetical protein